uniref:Tyrosine specific protein phosphatases domain-containing protein n=1 Tax=Alexandrium catenella TaxID=2925 RepID=A0A7S1RFX0_ALECA|mmetsp:Transcript_56011/g.149900  ORF Transcript_56011/g.149900 Transcript_56011/m.149900 type:complete len:264 (+) Transcript_56011:106-897(+)|eukprot:CAMPEP_0171203440 /NCGR_PEP_ID=MMETSP0790-20130122/25523_1 /TAXON_ID=2925 /ORGANISM="Alexandrium catenella, Strain OF101" /LENGTH=263 /DNA_ID=CAMNT_0011668903 /DNA_START=95 /DNA_END=886 /DNA_ORIENTATION=-
MWSAGNAASDQWFQQADEDSTAQGGARALKRTIDAYPPPEPPPKRYNSGLNRTLSTSSWSDDGSWAASRWQGVIGPQDQADIRQWKDCSSVGSNVPGTPIVPCKTPFEGSLANRAYEAGLIADEDWFGKDDLVQACINQGTPIGLVVDLVNTEKYYSGFSEDTDGIEYQKVRIPGRTVPERAVLEEIFDTIDDFVSRRPGEYVAVHCTHGINRTGFLVSAYLMTRAHLPKCGGAVAAFEKARGSKMDKQYLLEALMELEEGKY